MTLFVVPSAATVMRSVQIAGAQLSCGATVDAAEASGGAVQPPAPLDSFDSNVFMLSIGDADFATYAGAVVSAILFHVLIIALGFLFAA